MSSLWGKATNLEYEIKKFCVRIGAKNESELISREVRYLIKEVLDHVVPERSQNLSKSKRENATLDIIDEKRNDLGL